MPAVPLLMNTKGPSFSLNAFSHQRHWTVLGCLCTFLLNCKMFPGAFCHKYPFLFSISSCNVYLCCLTATRNPTFWDGPYSAWGSASGVGHARMTCSFSMAQGQWFDGTGLSFQAGLRECSVRPGWWSGAWGTPHLRPSFQDTLGFCSLMSVPQEFKR